MHNIRTRFTAINSYQLPIVHESAYLSLVTLGDTTAPQLRDSLLRMALAPETPAGLALYQALLAFSALCRQGNQQQAMELTVTALHSLSESTQAGLLPAGAQAAQHVAASMLLGASDVGFALPIYGYDDMMVRETNSARSRCSEDPQARVLGSGTSGVPWTWCVPAICSAGGRVTTPTASLAGFTCTKRRLASRCAIGNTGRWQQTQRLSQLMAAGPPFPPTRR